MNTQLMRLTNWLFGPWEWSLRLPNVLAFLVYSYGTWIIVKRANAIWIGLAGIVFILINPFALEFFSLARGYGLSLSFTVLAFALFIQSRESDTRTNRLHLYVGVASFFAVLANLNAINFILMLYGWMIIDQIQTGKGWIKRFGWAIMAMTITLVFAIGSLLILRGNDDLRFGAPSYYASFMRTTRLILYVDEQPIWFTEWMGIIAAVLVSSIVLFVIWKKRYTSNLAVSVSILIGILLGWYIEHEVLGANLPEGRMLVNLLPVLGFVFFFLAGEPISNSVLRKLRFTIIITLFTGYLVNFGLSFNLHTTHRWYDSARTKEAIYFVGDIVSDWEEPASFERFNIYKNSTNYYISTRNLNIELTEKNGIRGKSDFLFTHDWEWDRVEPLMGDRYRKIWSKPNYPMSVYQSVASIEEHGSRE